MPSKINNRLRSAAWATPLLGLIALATAIGCAGKSSKSKWSFSNWDVKKAVGMKPEKPEPEKPERMVATWTDTTLSTAGHSTKRGFGGKLMFFKRGSEDPVRVEGNLVVYAFDETDRPDHETQPTRRYIFPMDEFVRHESESSLGPTYSFWLPWDEIGGQQRHISLIAKFEPKDGPVVIGEQTRHLLPGLTHDPNADKPQLAKIVQTENGEQVRLAAYSGQAAATVPPGASEHSVVAPTRQREMSTATIPLPKRLSEAAAQEQTSTFSKASAATPLSQLSTMKSESHQPTAPLATAPTSQVVQASATMPVVPAAATMTTATQRRAMIEAAKEAAAPAAAPGSLRDSLLRTLPAQARPSGR
jgi:hypothetical protein